jgi:ABC-2 type transport system ATP-binding protein
LAEDDVDTSLPLSPAIGLDPGQTEAAEVIELKSLQKVIDQKTAIDIEALRVKAGEIAALVGPVGSGKDTLFELLTGRSRPTVGEVRLNGIDPYAEKGRFSRQVGVLFPEDNLYKRQSARGNLRFYCRLRRLPKSRAAEVLAQVGLADHAHTKVEKLPSGLARRLALGRAILNDPEVLLLVDPFAKCDDASVSLLSKLMRQLADDGAAMLIIAEDTTNLTSLCDIIYRLDQGRIVDVYKPEEEQRSGLPFMIPARLEEGIALVNPVDILYVEVQDDRTFLRTPEDYLPTQFTLTELEKRLARSGFFRAHRSYLVNLQHVKEVIPFTRDSYILKLKDPKGTEIPLSKSAARELRELLDY